MYVGFFQFEVVQMNITSLQSMVHVLTLHVLGYAWMKARAV